MFSKRKIISFNNRFSSMMYVNFENKYVEDHTEKKLHSR